MGFWLANILVFGVGIILVIGVPALVFLKLSDNYRSGIVTTIGIPALIAVIGIFATTMVYVGVYKTTEHTEIIKITGKERTSGDNGQYVVYTGDGGTRGVTDTIAYWNFRASDRYGRLLEGHTYSCLVAGWRVGVVSEYPNLIRCTEVEPQAKQ